jgi:cellulose synthase/poly-beta-1,6-N-acetylglucosamine synthase-like glycosyltransferase
MDDDLKVSVVIVCYNESKNIEQCIKSILSQTYPRGLFEIVIVDNNSTDGTIDKIKKFKEVADNLELYINPVRSISKSRNMGIMRSKHGLVAFTDADCIAPADWLKTLVHGYAEHKNLEPFLVAVGGANIPPQGANRFYDSLKIMVNTFLGSGGSVQGMVLEQDGYVSHIPTVNVLYEKEAVMKEGGFDEKMGSIEEDEDLSWRLVKKGYKFLYLKNSFVWHKMRENLWGWVKNMFIYGKGKIWLFKKHPDKFNLFLLPPMFLAALILSAGVSRNALLLSILLFYVIFIFLLSLYECHKAEKLHLTFNVFTLYLTTHIAYGIGEWYGLAMPIGKG